MPAQFYEYKDKPAYRLSPGQVPFVLRFNDEREQEWMPHHEPDFESEAVPIGEPLFRELAGDAAKRMPVRV